MTRIAGAGERQTATSGGRANPRRTGPRHTGRWDLRTNVLSFYLHSRVTLRPDHLHVLMHRTLLGLVPLGTVNEKIALGDLNSLGVRLVIRPARLAVATALVAVGLVLQIPMPARVGIMLLALAMVFLGVAFGIRVEVREGDRLVIPVCVAQRAAAAAAVRQVERALGARKPP